MTNEDDWSDVEITVTLNLTHSKPNMPKSWDNPSEFFFTRKFKQSYGPRYGGIESWLNDAIKKVASEMQDRARSVSLPLKKPESSMSNTAYSDPEHGFNTEFKHKPYFPYNEEW